MSTILEGIGVVLLCILLVPWFVIGVIAYWGWCGKALKKVERYFGDHS